MRDFRIEHSIAAISHCVNPNAKCPNPQSANESSIDNQQSPMGAAAVHF
jgi:hypothetical protein